MYIYKYITNTFYGHLCKHIVKSWRSYIKGLRLSAGALARWRKPLKESRLLEKNSRHVGLTALRCVSATWRSTYYIYRTYVNIYIYSIYRYT